VTKNCKIDDNQVVMRSVVRDLLVRRLLARQHAGTPQVALLTLLGYSIRVGKAEQIYPSRIRLSSDGGASKPHRSKYILVGPSFQQLPHF
jgi:hypothetical protein